jgi:DNA-binding XRE family transcriptional regulator
MSKTETTAVSPTDTHPIRDARIRHQLTQEVLGRALGVTKATVSKWEQGQALPEPPVAFRLADALDLTLEDVYASARAAA